MVRGRVGHHRRHQVPFGYRVQAFRRDVNESVVPCSTAGAHGPLVLAALASRDQHLYRLTLQRPVLFPGDLVDQFHQTGVALLHHVGIHLLRHRGCGGSGSLRVQERERTGESRLTYDIHRRQKVLFGLTGEADDDVRRDGCMGQSVANVVEDSQVAITAVGTPHGLQDSIGSRLQGHVQGGHDVVGGRHRIDDVVGEVPRVRAGEPHALETINVSARSQEVGKGATVVELDAVRVDVLPQQRDLGDPIGHERFDLRQDLARPSILLLAA